MLRELVAETSENLHVLTRLSARQTFNELCRRESLQTYNSSSASQVILCLVWNAKFHYNAYNIFTAAPPAGPL